MSRENYEEMELKLNGNRTGEFDPLGIVPFKTQKLYDHYLELVKKRIDTENIDENETVAIATIDKVSYDNAETGEVDIRWEARYEIVV